MTIPAIIVLDCRMVGERPHGISQYVLRLLEGLTLLREQQELEYKLILLTSPEFSRLSASQVTWYQQCEVDIPFLHPTELFLLREKINSLSPALYHSPSFSCIYGLMCPYILTVHDLNHLRYGSWAKKLYYKMILKRFCKKAIKVCTVSESIKDELQLWLNSNSEIEVVPNALPDDLSTSDYTEDVQLISKLGLEPESYFLTLSNNKPHKNLSFLVAGFRTHWKKKKHWPLVMNVPEFKEEGIITPSYIPDNLGRALLRRAGAVVFTSQYEGQGLPPIEGAALERRVIASDIPAHREGLQLVDDEIAWVNPYSLPSLSDAFDAAESGTLHSVSHEGAAKIREQFTVTKLARRMDMIYKRALASSS